MFNTPCFHLPPLSLGMFVQGKEVQRAKNRRQCIDLARVGLAEVGQSELPPMARNPLLRFGKKSSFQFWQEILCCPKFLLTSLYECGSHFREEEKSAAISLIPPRGPRPQTVDGNVRSIQPREGRTIFFQPCLLAIIR